MQVPLSDRVGTEQSWKSALMMLLALVPGLPQRSGVAVISCSLMAYWACSMLALHGTCFVNCKLGTHTQESAHRGREFSSGMLHARMEFCTMALHTTDVVYRA